MEREKNKLFTSHEKSKQAILRRIERDRLEQMKHRQSDTQRLLQRNKNLIKTIYDRQIQEKRKTKQFLNWALSDIHDIKEINQNLQSYTRPSKLPKVSTHPLFSLHHNRKSTRKIAKFQNFQVESSSRTLPSQLRKVTKASSLSSIGGRVSRFTNGPSTSPIMITGRPVCIFWDFHFLKTLCLKRF